MPIPPGPTIQATPSVPEPRPAAPTAIGAVLLAGAALAAGAMAWTRLGGITLPGCGAGSDCDRAANSPWGTVPGVEWPVSYLGLAYFLGMLVAWIAARGAPGPGLRWVIRAGGAASLLFIGVMVAEQMLCKYCLAAHVCNLLFVGVVEWSARTGDQRRPVLRGVAAAAVVFVIATAALGVAESTLRGRAQREYDRSVQEMVARSNQSAPPAPQVTTPTGAAAATGSTGATAPTGTTGAAASTGAEAPITPPRPVGFTGRFRIGPERAPIRVVMITDYQCPDCRQQENLLRTLMEGRTDISLSIKHFPFCPDCNPTPGVTNLHPNACWAARAAETAGLLYGNDGFEKMHHWLFSRGGGFTDPELRAALPSLGFETERFIAMMQSDLPLQGIRADIQEAVSLGLQRTPMIFINGVELKNWNVQPDALPKAIQTLTAANPPPAGPENDRPPKAADKYVADWREAVAMAWPSRKQTWSTADPRAPVQITIFGDLLEPHTAAADRTVREAMAGRSDIYYQFRYFPLEQACNPTLPSTMIPYACRAAGAAEAAGQLWGVDAYWAMHEWITSHQAEVKSGGDTAIRGAATTLGFDAAALIAKMDSQDVKDLVAQDANIGYRIGMTEIPAIFINGKRVAGWNLPGGFVLERIIEEAATKAGR